MKEIEKTTKKNKKQTKFSKNKNQLKNFASLPQKVKKRRDKKSLEFNPYLQIFFRVWSLHQEVKCIPFLQQVICEVRMDRVF